MKKEIKEILLQSKINVQWKNFGRWQKEDINNLLEACETKNIKISGKPENLTITLNSNIKIIRKTSLCWLERDVIIILKMFYVYLGDKTKINTRFGKSIIN